MATATAPLQDPRLTTLGIYTKTVLENPYIFHKPTPKQAKFLMLPHREALFGGAAGGGKSDALLMAALQYVHEPGYAAIIFRKSYRDLAQPGAIMDRIKSWHATWTRELGLEAIWHEQDKVMTFPSGARIVFAHLAYENEKYKYQGAEYACICWDELTQFNANSYKFLFTRLRRLKGSTVPLRVRAGSNPGGVGHEWVRQRFVVTNGLYPDRKFIPSKLEDNPYLTYEEYVETLKELDPVTREQMLKGDWTARMAGGKFRREWFRMTADLPPGLILKWTPDGPIVITKPEGLQLVGYWDIAATEPRPGEDPDWTAGALVAEKDGQYWVLDIRRFRKTPKGVEDEVRATAERDGHLTSVYMEREPGASGKIVIDHYARKVLRGYAFWGNPAKKDKEVRANPVSSAAEAGNVFSLRRRLLGDVGGGLPRRGRGLPAGTPRRPGRRGIRGLRGPRPPRRRGLRGPRERGGTMVEQALQQILRVVSLLGHLDELTVSLDQLHASRHQGSPHRCFCGEYIVALGQGVGYLHQSAPVR